MKTNKRLQKRLVKAGFRIIGQVQPSTKHEIEKLADDFLSILDKEVTGFDKNSFKKAFIGFLTTAVLFSAKEASAPDMNADLRALKMNAPQEVSIEIAFNMGSGEYEINVDGYILNGIYKEKPQGNIHRTQIKKPAKKDQSVSEMMQGIVDLIDKGTKK